MEVLERGFVLAKQVLSQLSYTPALKVALILKHLPLFRIPILRKIVRTDVPNKLRLTLCACAWTEPLT
jgi:hypothetical protein